MHSEEQLLVSRRATTKGDGVSELGSPALRDIESEADLRLVGGPLSPTALGLAGVFHSGQALHAYEIQDLSLTW